MTVANLEYDPAVVMNNLHSVKALACELMKQPYYQKLGEVGIFAILEKARSIGMHPMEALNGGLYFVQGKVEMQGQAMLSFIRKAGHSVQIDPSSTQTYVKMIGRRADNGDSWIVEFSYEDAKRAGLVKGGGPWEKYTHTMCVWRCVSMLSRFLFSDIILGCYVEGEISESNFDAPKIDLSKISKPQVETISEDQHIELLALLARCGSGFVEKLKDQTFKHLKISQWSELPLERFEGLKSHLKENISLQKNLEVVVDEINDKTVDADLFTEIMV